MGAYYELNGNAASIAQKVDNLLEKKRYILPVGVSVCDKLIHSLNM